jgi:hypothetical protein
LTNDKTNQACSNFGPSGFRFAIRHSPRLGVCARESRDGHVQSRGIPVERPYEQCHNIALSVNILLSPSPSMQVAERVGGFRVLDIVEIGIKTISYRTCRGRATFLFILFYEIHIRDPSLPKSTRSSKQTPKPLILIQAKKQNYRRALIQ